MKEYILTVYHYNIIRVSGKMYFNRMYILFMCVHFSEHYRKLYFDAGNYIDLLFHISELGTTNRIYITIKFSIKQKERWIIFISIYNAYYSCDKLIGILRLMMI